MTSINIWGPAVWDLFHCISIKVKSEQFQNCSPLIIKIIKNIAFNLPCPECKHHAIEIFKNISHHNFKTKNDLINFLFNFHNHVNDRTNKSHYSFEKLEKYRNMNFIQVINHFYVVFSKKYNNMNLMLAQFNRNTMIKTFQKDIVELLQYCNI